MSRFKKSKFKIQIQLFLVSKFKSGAVRRRAQWEAAKSVSNKNEKDFAP